MQTPKRKKIISLSAIFMVCTSMLFAPASGIAAVGAGIGIPGEGNDWPMQKGLASFYGKGTFQTACGKTLRSEKQLAVAHKSLPCGTKILFARNGVQEVGVVVDRGPYVGNRVFDLSYKLAKRLDVVSQGVAMVRYRIVG